MEKSFETEYVYRMSSDILFMIDGAEMVSVSITGESDCDDNQEVSV